MENQTNSQAIVTKSAKLTKLWKCEHYASKAKLQKDGVDAIVQANTKGEARNLFKKSHGEKATRKKGGRTGRIRLPAGFRVLNAN